MQVPLVGPLVYVPMQFAAAWLLHLLLTDVPTRPLVAALQGSQVTSSRLDDHHMHMKGVTVYC